MLSIANYDRDTKLLPQQLGQPSSVPQVDPFADTSTLLVVHTLVRNSPVEAFRARDGRGQPDLLVWRLLVEDVGAVWWVGH